MKAPQPPAPHPQPSAVARAGNFVARVLWTVLPSATLGLAGWVPAVHIARRRRTRAAWIWLAGLVAAAVGEIVLLEMTPDGNLFAGFFAVAYLITATVYAWHGCGVEPPAPSPAGYGPWTPASYEHYNAALYPAPAATDMAAEIQADLRELRGLLGGGEAR